MRITAGWSPVKYPVGTQGAVHLVGGNLHELCSRSLVLVVADLPRRFCAMFNRFTVPNTLVLTKISGSAMLRSTWLSAAKLTT